MYAITWNSTGDKMIQVGIEPVRLLAEIKQNDVSTVVSNMPMYQGMNLYVADLDTHEILGATDENTIGKKLEAIGMPRAYLGGTKMVSGIVKIQERNTTAFLNRWENTWLVLPLRYLRIMRAT